MTDHSVGPLKGIRVLDFTWGGAGPFATKALADHGAEVIKVETSTHLDFPRTMGPYPGKVKGINRSAYFTNRNSSKLGVTLNLKTPEAVALTKKLAATCDVVVNNFRAGTLEKLGLGYQEVAALNPDVIYVSMPLQGTAGPQAGFSGVGHTLNVLAGLYGLTGYRNGTVVGPGTNYPDHSVNPGHALVAIMAALIQRKRTGLGQYIEVSQLESTLATLGPDILAYSIGRENPKPCGNYSETAAPYGLFACADDRWIAISVSDDAQWQGLCRAGAGALWATDAALASRTARLKAKDALNAMITRWTGGRDAFELMRLLQSNGVPAGVVQNAEDLVERDPQLKARGHFVEIAHPEMGPTVYNGVPYTLSRTPASLRGAPMLGQHNRDVFLSMIGIDEKDYEDMSARDVFK